MAARIRVPRITTGYSMGTTATHVEGVQEVMDLLDSLRTLAPQKYRDTLEYYALQIETGYKGRIHSVTGSLVSSVKTRKTFNENTNRVSVIAGGEKAPHAHLVEFGHRQITKDGRIVGDVPPKPHMRNTFEAVLPSLVAELESIIDALT